MVAEGNGKAEKQPQSNAADHLKQHQWKKGQSGNPGGRKPGRTFTAIANRFLAEHGDAGLKELVEHVVEQANKGNSGALRELLARIDPAPATTDITINNNLVGSEVLDMLGRLKATTGFRDDD